MSMKNSSDTIENQSCDLPVCNAVPQTLRHRVPPVVNILYKIHEGILPLKTSKVILVTPGVYPLAPKWV
jgi:hypothetical protein